ncbi:MAG: WD40 repeat domain-containing protein [Bacteroidia bacterium]
MRTNIAYLGIFLLLISCGDETVDSGQPSKPIWHVSNLTNDVRARFKELKKEYQSDEIDALLDRIDEIEVLHRMDGSECGDSLYWSIVKLGIEAVPFLIEMVDETDETPFLVSDVIDVLPSPFDPQGCDDWSLTEGDIAFLLLSDIVPFIYPPSGVQQCTAPPCGYTYEHLDEINGSRKVARDRILQYYVEHERNYVSGKIDSLVENDILIGPLDCRTSMGIHTLIFYIDRPEESPILWTADWSHDGRWLAIGGDYNYFRLHRPNGANLAYNFSVESYLEAIGTVNCVDWHPSKDIAAIASGSHDDQHAFLLTIEKDETLFEHWASVKELELPEGARSLDWNHTGDKLATADNEGSISIFDTEGNLLGNFTRPKAKSGIAIEWHPHRNSLIMLSDSIYAYDDTGNRLYTREHRNHADGFSLLLSVAWHPDGDFYAIGDYGNPEEGVLPLLQFWSEDGVLLKSIEGHKAEIRNMVWNASGSQLATASDALRIWSKEGELLHEGVSRHNLWGIDWRNDSIVTSSGEGDVIYWQVNDSLLKL